MKDIKNYEAANFSFAVEKYMSMVISSSKSLPNLKLKVNDIIGLCNKVNKDIQNKNTSAEINQFYEKVDGVFIQNFTKNNYNSKIFVENETISFGFIPNPKVKN